MATHAALTHPKESNCPTRSEWVVKRLVEVYILVDKLGDITAINVATHRLVRNLDTRDHQLANDTVIRAWQLAPPGPTLCRLLVDNHVLQYNYRLLGEHLRGDDLPPDFACAVAQCFAEWCADNPGDSRRGGP